MTVCALGPEKINRNLFFLVEPVSQLNNIQSEMKKGPDNDNDNRSARE